MALADELRSWAAVQLDAAVVDVLFELSHLSVVVGLRLSDRREVVVKARPHVARASACVEAQRALNRDGFPCPRPLSQVHEVDGLAVHIEHYEPADEAPGAIDAGLTEALAVLLADLHERSRRLGLSRPRPRPPWLAWDHDRALVWAEETPEQPPPWLIDVAQRAGRRLRLATLDELVGHADWEVQNMGWRDGRVTMVYDWDSLASASEAELAGAAAATFASGRVQPVLAPITLTDGFLAAYQSAVGRAFTSDELEVAWAAGLWLAAHNAHMELRYAKPPLVLTQLQHDAAERLLRAHA